MNCNPSNPPLFSITRLRIFLGEGFRPHSPLLFRVVPLSLILSKISWSFCTQRALMIFLHSKIIRLHIHASTPICYVSTPHPIHVRMNVHGWWMRMSHVATWLILKLQKKKNENESRSYMTHALRDMSSCITRHELWYKFTWYPILHTRKPAD